MESLVSYDSSSSEDQDDNNESSSLVNDNLIGRQNQGRMDTGSASAEFMGSSNSNPGNEDGESSSCKGEFLCKAREKLNELRKKREQVIRKDRYDLKKSNYNKVKEGRGRKRRVIIEGGNKSAKRSEESEKDPQILLAKAFDSQDSMPDLKDLNLPIQDFKVCNEYDPHGRKKTRIEKDLDEAIKEGNFLLAEKISDEMTDRDAAVTITNAMNAKKYLAAKKEIEERKNQKKKKLHWSFDQKERWEVKGNM